MARCYHGREIQVPGHRRRETAIQRGSGVMRGTAPHTTRPEAGFELPMSSTSRTSIKIEIDSHDNTVRPLSFPGCSAVMELSVLLH